MGTPGHLLHLARMYWRYAVVRSARVPYSPVRLWVEMTNACNLKCVMCPTSLPSAPKPGMMEPDLFRKIVDEASAFAYDMAVHHRGSRPSIRSLLPCLRMPLGKGFGRNCTPTGLRSTPRRRRRSSVRASITFPSRSTGSRRRRTRESGSGVRSRRRSETSWSSCGSRNRWEAGSRTPSSRSSIFRRWGTSIRTRGGCSSSVSGICRSTSSGSRPHNWAGSYDASKVPSKRRFVPCTFPWFALVIFWDGTAVTCPQDFFGAYPWGTSGMRRSWRSGAGTRSVG